jgi:predicted nucleic acid-binding protein
MEIVVNEWLLDYMCPDSEDSDKIKTFKFVNAWVKKCDKVVIRRTSPFTSKFYRHMKKFGWNTDFKKHFSRLNHLLFYNSDKTIIVEEADIKKLPKEIEEKTPLDDKYLIELAYSSRDKIIVTTDQRLKEKLHDDVDLKIYLLDEFLGEYLS